MHTDYPEPGSPEDWLRYARSDLEIARVTRSGDMLLEGLCFHAQQTAEKALKAVLLSMKIPFPRTHSIRRLLDLLPTTLAIPETVQESAILTDYAVTVRYPGEVEPVEQGEYEQALHIAEQILNWAEQMLEKQTAAQEEAQASSGTSICDHDINSNH